MLLALLSISKCSPRLGASEQQRAPLFGAEQVAAPGCRCGLI